MGRIYEVKGGGGGGGGGVTLIFGKTRFGDNVYQKAPPIGGTFGEVSESLRLLRSARRPRPQMVVAWR